MNELKERTIIVAEDILDIQEKLSLELDRAQKEHQDKMEVMKEDTSGKIDRIKNEIRNQTGKVMDDTEVILDQST